MRAAPANTEAIEVVRLPIVEEGDLIRVRQAIRSASGEAGLGLVDLTKLVTAASELARNILTYAVGGGALLIEVVRLTGRQGVRATFSDEGPGIEDVDAALRDGFSTGGSLGLGLPGCRRLADEMSVDSRAGHGTVVIIVKWTR